MKKKIIIILIILSGIFINGCSDADVASSNLSTKADNFEIYRRVVFYNGITDTYILTVEGFCSVSGGRGSQLSVTIKLEDGTYLKHFLGLSDNVTYFSEQLISKNVSTKHYRVIFKPSVIIPNVDLK